MHAAIAKVGKIGNAGEGLAIALVRSVEAEDERGTARILPVGARRVADEARGVDLVWSSVVAGLIEAGSAHEELEVAEVAAGKDECVLAVNIAGDIDRPALRGSFLNVAVGADEAAGGEEIPRPMMSCGQQAVVVGAFAAVGASYRRWSLDGACRKMLTTPPMALDP